MNKTIETSKQFALELMFSSIGSESYDELVDAVSSRDPEQDISFTFDRLLHPRFSDYQVWHPYALTDASEFLSQLHDYVVMFEAFARKVEELNHE
jgi:hypothetical protein